MCAAEAHPRTQDTPIKKITKATIATAAGVALLLGTGGTLAYWNDQADLSQPTAISAGELKIVPTTGSSAWDLVRGAKTDKNVNLAALKIVPGDKLVYTTKFDVVADGRNLAMQVKVAPGSITPATPGGANDKLASYLNTTKVGKVSVNGAAAVSTDTAVDVTASGTDGQRTVPVVVTYELTFPYDAAATTNNDAKNGKVDLSQFSVAVQQTINGATP